MKMPYEVEIHYNQQLCKDLFIFIVCIGVFYLHMCIYVYICAGIYVQSQRKSEKDIRVTNGC